MVVNETRKTLSSLTKGVMGSFAKQAKTHPKRTGLGLIGAGAVMSSVPLLLPAGETLVLAGVGLGGYGILKKKKK